MNNDFPRIVTLLRKERGISQKQAAMELGISQALLSHYEKGIRECGLDFVVRIADYYEVSCDYLLGRTVERSGSIVRYEAAEAPQQTEVSDEGIKSNALLTMNKKLLFSSLQILFDILEKIDHKGLSADVSSYLMVSVYKMLRSVYAANARNPQAMFSVIPEIYGGMSTALQNVLEACIGCMVSGKSSGDYDGLSSTDAPLLSHDVISRSHPDLAPALYNMIREVEEKMKKLV